MELDDMKTLWDAYDRKLDTSIRLTTRLLNAPMLKKAQTAMTRLVRLWQIECALNLAAVVWLGWFESNHFTQPRFLVPALVLHAGGIALLITYARRILAVRRIDYAQPIMAIQKALESVRIAEIHATKWTLLLAPIAWTPFLIVAFKGLFNVDAYTTFSTAWLAGNVLFVPTHDFVRPSADSPNPSHGHHEFGNAETYFLVGDALGKAMKELLPK